MYKIHLYFINSDFFFLSGTTWRQKQHFAKQLIITDVKDHTVLKIYDNYTM